MEVNIVSNVLDITAIYEQEEQIKSLPVTIKLEYFHSSWCEDEILDNVYAKVFDTMNASINGSREFIGLDLSDNEIVERIVDFFTDN